MADNAPHVTPGPGSDPLDAAFAPPPGADHAGDIVAAETSVTAPDVEVLGRTSAPQAQLERASAPVLVGASSASSENGRPSALVMDRGGPEPPLDLPTGAGAGGDLPVWSFREGSGRDRATAPPAAPVNRNQVELPFGSPAEAEAPSELAARPQPLFGPIGRPQSPAVVALLAVVTLGVYALVWHHRVNRELEEFDPKIHSRPMRSTVAVAIPWLLGLAVTIAGAALILGARLSIHIPFASHVTAAQADYMLAGLVAVPYLLLLVPFSLVAMVMTLERLRCVEEHVGTTTDRQVRAVGASMLLLMPVVGGLVLLGVAQRRLNAVWDAVAPTGRLVH